MRPYVHLRGTQFQYTDRGAYQDHMTRVSPSAFFSVNRSTPDHAVLNYFDQLGFTLYRQTDNVLRTGGLFHLKAYARQMIQIDEELRRRAGGGEWAHVDLSQTRSSLASLANITILPPPTSRPPMRRQAHPGPNPPPQIPTGRPPRQIDPEDALRDPLYPTRGQQSPNTPGNGSRLSWIDVESRDTNIAPGVNTRDGITYIGGVHIGRIGGQAGNIPRIAQQWYQEGARDAERDFRSRNRVSAHQTRLRSGRYNGNSDYQNGYNDRWEQLQH